MSGIPGAPNNASVPPASSEKVLGSLTEWAEHALEPMGHVPAAHHRLLLRELENVTAGTCDRLMLLMPPGAAKSTYTSVLFPAWWLARRPGSAVIAASHTHGLAWFFGARVRDLLREHEAILACGLVRGAAGAGQFRTNNGSTYYAVGVRGPVAGRRADLLLIDDPIKSQADANNPAARGRMWTWYRSDLATRLKPRGAIVLVMTRWHVDDLAGSLLAADDGWRVVQLPALAEIDDPLGRAPGEALWPEWEDAAFLARKRNMVGERVWAALYQQRPMAGTGGVFKPGMIPLLDDAPAVVTCVRGWDLASRAGDEGDPDWTVGVKLGRTSAGMFVVLDVVRLRGSPGEIDATIRRTAERDGAGVVISLPQDPGQAGRSQVHYLTGRLAGYVVSSSAETGPKMTRAMPVASQADVGNLALVRAAWNGVLLDELGDFPSGRKDDQVDALSRAFGQLLQNGNGAREISLPFMSR